MNNSKLAIESVGPSDEVFTKELLLEREREVAMTIENLQVIHQTREWSSLKGLVFDSLRGNLEKQLLLESKKQNPDTQKLNRLAGELKWAERFSDLSKWENELRVELKNIKQQLHG